MDYPHIIPHLSREDLIEQFTLTQEERYCTPQWREEKNILGFGVLLKTFLFLGYGVWAVMEQKTGLSSKYQPFCFSCLSGRNPPFSTSGVRSNE